MDDIRELIHAQANINLLAKEIEKCGSNLIREHTNKNGNIYISKISYMGYIQQFKNETAKFEKLLENFETINNKYITDNIQSDSESTEINNQFISEYKTSVPMTDILSIHDKQSQLDTEEKTQTKPIKQVIKKKKVIKKAIKTVKNGNCKKKIVFKNTNDSKLHKNVSTRNQRKRNHKKKLLNNNNNNNNTNNRKPVEIFTPTKMKPMTVVNNVELVNSKQGKKTNQKQKSKTTNNRKTYNKSGIKGFGLYKGKPIYCSLLLRCHEMCGKNKGDLKKYLIKYGNFEKRMIEKIIFRYKDSLIRVRGPLNIIQQRIFRLNNAKGDMFGDVIELFESTLDKNVSAAKVLYVNNFDILNGECHKRFTKLFSEFGELKQHIIMSIDRNSDPFAIIQYKHLKEAKQCVEYRHPTVFDGKILNINYSKY